MTGSILLIEDDPAVLHLLKAVMDYGGFGSATAASASEARDLLASQPFASVILDHALPDADGHRLIQDIRKSCSIPIVVVSGRTDEKTRIEALDAGADDFVPKPFLPGELLARLRAVMRRYETAVPEDRQGSPLGAQIEASDRRRQRRVLEEKLLRYLDERAGELTTSDEIIAHVWGRDKARTERNVRVLIALLRRTLKAQGAAVEIVNEHSRGYRLRRKIGGVSHSTRDRSS